MMVSMLDVKPILEVKNLQVAYGGIKALQGISFHINKGEVVSLIGANGAGKSSTLRAISGMVPSINGTIIYNNKDITKLAHHQIAREGLAHVPEGRGIFSRLTVKENLIVGSYTREKRYLKDDMGKVFELFPRLKERITQSAGSLSGGEQQMLAIGRAIMSGAETLLMDEPSMGLAPLFVQEIFSIIRKLNADGKTILLVEQNANQALKTAQRAYILETGRIVMGGDSEGLIDNQEIKRAYLGGH